MFAWIQKYLISVVLGFVVRQLMKWTDGIKWDLVIEDLKVRIPALVPGEWFDATATEFVVRLVEIARDVLTESLIKKVIGLAAEGKFVDALIAIKEAIVGSVFPDVIADGVAPLSETELDAYVVKAVSFKFDKGIA